MAANRYVGHELITVPAFPAPVDTAKIHSVVTQAGALGDPFGSGVRTVWWVYGVGPVKILFEHTAARPRSSQLQHEPGAAPLPSDPNLMPLKPGVVGRFRWRNDRHMKRWSTQRFDGRAAWSTTPRASTCVTSRARSTCNASYVFSNRLGGLRSVSTVYRRATTRNSCRPWARATGRRAGGASSPPSTS